MSERRWDPGLSPSPRLGSITTKNPDDRKRERLNTELLSAVFRLDVRKVVRLLSDEFRPEVDARCVENQATSLHIAVMRGDEDSIKELLARGANPNKRDSLGRLPLHLAAWEGNIRVLTSLLEASPNSINVAVAPEPQTFGSKCDCSWDHNHGEVTALMSLVMTTTGSTALHIASMHRQPAVVEFLLAKGADYHAKDRSGRTPIDVAGLGSNAKPVTVPLIPITVQQPEPDFPVDQSFPKPTLYAMPTTMSSAQSPQVADGSFIPASFFQPPSLPASPINLAPSMTKAYEPVGMEAVDMNVDKALFNILNSFIKSGAKLVKDDAEADSPDGSALHSAILSNEINGLKLLLAEGATLDTFDRNGDSPLHLAVRERKLELVLAIVPFLGPGEIDMKNKQGVTALFLAVSSEWREGVNVLLESKASVTVKSDANCETVFHISAKLGNVEMMKELMSVEGAAQVLEDEDTDGLTPLHLAIESQSLGIVELLVDVAEVNVGVIIKDGSNVIHFAVAVRKKENKSENFVLQFLLNNSTCVKLVNDINPSFGLAPLHIAADNGDEYSAECLLKAGAQANLSSTDEDRVTALHLAAQHGYRRTIITILNHDVTCLNAEDAKNWKPIHTACIWGHGKSAITMVTYGADLSDTIVYHGATQTALDLLTINVPRTPELLEQLLDDSIIVPPDKQHNISKFLNNPQCVITLDFDILLSADDSTGRQLMFLDALVNTNDPDVEGLMLHPLIEIFLYMKWEKLWKFFAILIGVYLVHITAFTAYCIMEFIEHYNSPVVKSILQLTFSVSLVPILLAETLQLLRLERRYWNDPESWLKWTMIFTSGTVGYTTVFWGDFEWNKHISSLAILTSWIELLFLCSRFSYWGLDVLMFEKVIENVVTVLSKFIFLFLGFMFALMIHFEGRQPFQNFWDSMCQVIVMIIELDYAGAFGESTTTVDIFVGRLIYLGYMVFVALAMMNLTVGLAVSDIAALEKQGKVESLIKRASFLSFLETLVYHEKIDGYLSSGSTVRHGKANPSFRSVDSVFQVQPNKPGILPYPMKAALVQKLMQICQNSESKDSPNTEKLDTNIGEIEMKIKKISEQLEELQKKFK